MNEEEFLIEMKNFFENIDKLRIDLEEQIKETELARNDLLHELELAKLDGVGMMKVAKTLKEVLLERRKYKDELVNFDRIESIWIGADEEGRVTIEATADINSTLGTYSTEERAKEVLEEILEYKSMFEFFKYVTDDVQEKMVDDFIKNNVIFNTYEMPEK